MLVGKDMRCTSMKSISIIFSKFRISHEINLHTMISLQCFIIQPSNIGAHLRKRHRAFSDNKHRCTAVQQTCIHLPELEIELNQSLFWRSLQYLLMMICHSLFHTMKFPRHQVDPFFGVWVDPMHFCSKWHNHHESCNASQKCRRFQGEQGLALCAKTWNNRDLKHFDCQDFDTTWPLLWEVPESRDIAPIVHIVCPADVYQGTSPSSEGVKRAEAEKFE